MTRLQGDRYAHTRHFLVNGLPIAANHTLPLPPCMSRKAGCLKLSP